MMMLLVSRLLSLPRNLSISYHGSKMILENFRNRPTGKMQWCLNDSMSRWIVLVHREFAEKNSLDVSALRGWRYETYGLKADVCTLRLLVLLLPPGYFFAIWLNMVSIIDYIQCQQWTHCHQITHYRHQTQYSEWLCHQYIGHDQF